MKKILLSLAIIAAGAAVVTGATMSFFSDTETSVGNTFTAGTIDISVDGENPWNSSWSNYLDKPCQVNYMVFEIKNVGKNPARIWKHLHNVETNGGESIYPPADALYIDTSMTSIASSEPEYTEGGGVVTYNNGTPTFNNTNYVEEHNLAAYMIYDMAICKHPYASDTVCPYIDDDPEKGPKLYDENGVRIPNDDWEIIIDEDQEIRIDNVSCNWIYLGTLQPGRVMIVVQSYHLKAWTDAGVETITNWAQGDVMKFDIELEARQITAPAPVSPGAGTLILENKDSQWQAITGDNIQGTLSYNTSGPDFNYTLNATGLKVNTEYCLIYYYDPWPGVGGFDVECGTGLTTDTAGGISHVGVADIVSIPVPGDNNYPAGAKLWLVPASDYDQANDKMTDWIPANYLFEMNLIKYDKTS